MEKDVYVCESRYSYKHKTMKKIKVHTILFIIIIIALVMEHHL